MFATENAKQMPALILRRPPRANFLCRAPSSHLAANLTKLGKNCIFCVCAPPSFRLNRIGPDRKFGFSFPSFHLIGECRGRPGRNRGQQAAGRGRARPTPSLTSPHVLRQKEGCVAEVQPRRAAVQCPAQPAAPSNPQWGLLFTTCAADCTQLLKTLSSQPRQ